MAVTGNIGNEQVELSNAATEDTLRQLLSTMKTMNQSILRMSGSGSGSGGPSPANAPAAQLATTFGRLNPIVTAVQVGFNILSNMVGNLTSRIGFVAGAFVNFAAQAIAGTTSVSSFLGSLSQATSAIPLLGGAISSVIGIFQKMAEFQEANMQEYQKLTSVGVNFGGSLTSLRLAATNARMSLDEFGSFMVKNSSALTKLGGSLNQGAEAFSRLSKDMLSERGPGRHLLALGYTSAQVNQGLADYLEMTGYRSTQEANNTRQIINSSAMYMEQLDGLARITGKSREQQEEELKASTKNAAWQAALAMMTPEQKEKAIAGMADALAVGGKGAVDAFQSRIMGIAPDKAGAMFIATAGNAASVIDKSADMVLDGSADVRDMSKLVREGMRAAQQDFAKYGKEGLYAIIRQGGPTADALQALGITANRAANMTDTEIEAALKRQELSATEAKVMADANAALKDVGIMIMGFLTPVIKAFTETIGNISTSFKKFMESVNLTKLGEDLGVLATSIADYIKNVFSKEGRDKIINDLKYYLQLIMIEIKKVINPLYSEADAGKDKARLDMEKAEMDRKANLSLRTGEAFKAEEAAINKRLDESKKANDKFSTISTGESAGLAGGALAGAAMGAIIGSAVPIIGTAIGGVIGGAIGAYSGAATGKGIGNLLTEKRDTGSIGKTGKLFENWGSGTQVELHGSEAVITPDQMATLVSNAVMTSQNNNLKESLQQLNSLTKEMLAVMKDSSENIKRNVDATKSLNRNLYPT